MRGEEKVRDVSDLKIEIKKTVLEMAQRYHFSPQEVESSLARSFKYFLDCGYEEPQSWEKARELVETAVYSARENGFDLMGMVNHFLFSQRHRSQNGVRRY